MFNSNNILGAAYFIAFDVALRKVFTANNIGFPSMMAGCLLLFAVFVAAEILKPGLGDAVFNLLNPGAVLLAKWLPIFFVPGLAMLPLAPKFGSGVEVSLFIFIYLYLKHIIDCFNQQFNISLHYLIKIS